MEAESQQHNLGLGTLVILIFLSVTVAIVVGVIMTTNMNAPMVIFLLGIYAVCNLYGWAMYISCAHQSEQIGMRYLVGGA